MAIQESRFLVQIQGMDQNSFFLGKIDHETIQTWADSHHQKENSHYAKSIVLKTT